MKKTLLILVCGALLGAGSAPAGPGRTSILLVQVPAAGSPADGALDFCAEGSRIVLVRPGLPPTNLTPGFSSACDPDLSFDGRSMLFAGRRNSDDPFNIFSAALDGSGTKQLTRGLGDCREPLHLARASVTAPTFEDPVRWMAFTSTAADVVDDLGRRPAVSLYVTNLEPIEGREPVLWRTTYNLGGDFSPTVLRDGRVLFSSHQAGSVKLMTVTWAGDNLNLFATAADGTVPSMAAEVSGRRAVVVVESAAPGRGGRLVEISLRRPLHLRDILSGDAGRYLTPHSIATGEILVSHSREGAAYGVFLFDRTAGTVGRRIFDDPDHHDVDAIEVAPRTEPMARIPMLEFASVLDIEGFENAGQLHCMSVYDSDQEEILALEKGTVAWARFVEGTGLSAAEAKGCASSHENDSAAWPPPCVKTRTLGLAPVESDGSFFVNITGNSPFYIELLDRDRKVLHTLESWIWIRSKSQRGCIGCHENRELSPQNRATDALLKMQPTTLSGDPDETAERNLKSSHEPTTSGGTRP